MLLYFLARETVPLSAELLAELRGRVGPLVPHATGSPGSFAVRVRRPAGIECFHVHQMRHTFACRWLERGRLACRAAAGAGAREHHDNAAVREALG